MITVCSLANRTFRKKECWSFSNDKLANALAFARIGSQHGRVRRVMLCGRLVRVYSNGIKVTGALPMTTLRKRARACR